MKRKYLAKAQNLLSQVQSMTEADLKKLDYELGIDEAGRGPVFGPMIYSALWWPMNFAAELRELGWTDSKKLKQIDREELFEIIELLKGKLVFYAVQVLTPEFISNKMLAERGQTNLNLISHNSAIKLIKQAMDSGFNIKEAYLDTVGDAKRYETKIIESIDSPQTMVKVTPKADLLFKVVSAASIVAKVTRDKMIR